MNLTPRVAATAALLLTLSAGVSAAILSDGSSGSDDQAYAESNSGSALGMSAFEQDHRSTPISVTSGSMLAASAPTNGTTLNLLSPLPRTVTLPVGLTLAQAKPRAAMPLYLQRAPSKPLTNSAASAR